MWLRRPRGENSEFVKLPTIHWTADRHGGIYTECLKNRDTLFGVLLISIRIAKRRVIDHESGFLMQIGLVSLSLELELGLLSDGYCVYR